MKRSEMVECIQQELLAKIKGRQYDPRPKTDETFCGYAAEDLLDLIEGLGMLPPPRMSEPEHHERNGKQLETKPLEGWDKE